MQVQVHSWLQVQLKIQLVLQLLVYVLQSRHERVHSLGFVIKRMRENKSASGSAIFFLFIYFKLPITFSKLDLLT